MSSILIDTNVMVYCFDGKISIIDLLDDFLQQKPSVFTLKKCIDELSAINRDDVKSFFNSSGITIIEFDAGKNTDDTIIDFCLDKKCMLFTEDKNLRSKADKYGIKAISFFGRKLKFSK